MQSEKYLLWLDLEMTGLNPEIDVILEIASVVTTNDLEVVAEGPSLVIHQSDETLALMDEWNQKQHGQSGLIQSVQHSHIMLQEAYERTYTFVRDYCPSGKVPLCGNTIYQDRKFLRRYMPDIDSYLHYRLIDVSSVKEIVRRWYPHEQCAFFEKPSNHRAMDDVYASIAELKHYRQYFFKN